MKEANQRAFLTPRKPSKQLMKCRTGHLRRPRHDGGSPRKSSREGPPYCSNPAQRARGDGARAGRLWGSAPASCTCTWWSASRGLAARGAHTQAREHSPLRWRSRNWGDGRGERGFTLWISKLCDCVKSRGFSSLLVSGRLS